ncbi:hypothetical protein GMMP1_610002 [Candidatus Magnetomoraceae bacterium gMMP-1]
MEIDFLAESACGRVVLVEIKKTKKTDVAIVKKFIDNINIYQKFFSKQKVLLAFLSVGGFTKAALELFKKKRHWNC